MKETLMNSKTLFMCVSLILIFSFAAFANINDGSDKKMIHKTIEEYNQASQRYDYDKCISLWANEPYVSRMLMTNQFLQGWDTVKSHFKKRLDQLKAEPNNKYHATISDVKFYIRDKIAYVPYRLDMSGVENGIKISGKVKVFTILEKMDGIWKFVYEGFPESKFDNWDEREMDINILGYKLLQDKHFEEAIEIFKLNVKLYPNSENVYDSLAEAYLKAGNNELAIDTYKKLLLLNPDNKYAIDLIKKLEMEK